MRAQKTLSLQMKMLRNDGKSFDEAVRHFNIYGVTPSNFGDQLV